MVTVRDVATRAGVSVASVSRVINGRETVADDIRERVQRAIAELGYHPHVAARSLRQDRSRSIGLVIGDVTNPFFTELARAVEDEARAAGYSVLLGNGHEDAEREDEYLRELGGHRIDGLLLCPAPGDSPALREAVAAGRKVVLVDREIDGLDLPVVKSDSEGGVDALVAHLLGLGHRRLAIICGPLSTSTGRDRLAAFRAALSRAGVDLPEEYVREGDFRLESGSQAMAELLALPDAPEVVFAADNLMALGALRWARRARVAVPDTVGIASFDDVPWFEVLDPPLTAVAQPTAELGRTAVRTLLAALQGEPVGSTTLPVRLVPRRSCGEGER